MNLPLRELTNFNNTLTQQPSSLEFKPTQSRCLIEDVISISHTLMDFGDCIPGSVHEKKLSIVLKQAQKTPKVISMCVLCDDMLLTQLPEYIFGVRKENTFQYFDEFKFKAAQRGVYNFVVGVKTPQYLDYHVQAKLAIFMEDAVGSIIVDMRQMTVLPQIRCPKQLTNEDYQRMIKLGVIKNKSKKETKLVFKCNQNMNFTLMCELLGLQEDNGLIQLRPRSVQVTGKGMFVLSFITNCPLQLTSPTTQRRVLVLRIKDSNVHFHFPVQVTFYPQGQRASSEME